VYGSDLVGKSSVVVAVGAARLVRIQPRVGTVHTYRLSHDKTPLLFYALLPLSDSHGGHILAPVK